MTRFFYLLLIVFKPFLLNTSLSWSYTPSGSFLFSLNFLKENVLMYLIFNFFLHSNGMFNHSNVMLVSIIAPPKQLYCISVCYVSWTLSIFWLWRSLPDSWTPLLLASMKHHSPGFSILLPSVCFLSSFSSTLLLNSILRADSHALFSYLSSFLLGSSTKTENYPGHFHLYHGLSYHLYRHLTLLYPVSSLLWVLYL